MIQFPSERWNDYGLIDCGDGEKLERFGRYTLIRPEPKAVWHKAMGDAAWLGSAHTRFSPGAGFGKAGKEDSGTWQMLRKMQEQWYISYPLLELPASNVLHASETRSKISLRLGMTAFKHVGVFPEQAPNWDFIYSHTRPGMKVLNLFAYTGAASLVARAAGADVTHLDSVRQVVTWARGNMENSGLQDIRWVVEDALSFVKREQKRGHLYDAIILDPPAYGHGPDGERWKLDDCLFEMMQLIGKILKPVDSYLILNLYSNGYTPALAETVVREALGITSHSGEMARLESGELALKDSAGRILPLSTVVRLMR